jgi:hypothetical protein
MCSIDEKTYRIRGLLVKFLSVKCRNRGFSLRIKNNLTYIGAIYSAIVKRALRQQTVGRDGNG